MRNACFCILIALGCALSANLGLFGPGEYAFSPVHIVMMETFGISRVTENSIIELTAGLIPFLLFQLIEGTEIYRHYSISGVYYMIRCPKRRQWFFRETLKLMPIAGAFSFILIGTGLVIAFFQGHLSAGTPEQWGLILSYLLCITIYLWTITVAVNIISMFLGSMWGYGIAAGLQLMLSASLLVFASTANNVFSVAEDAAANRLQTIGIKSNPISHLILSWHSDGQLSGEQILPNLYGIDFSLWESLAVMLGVAIVVCIAAVYFAEKVEVLNDRR